MTHNPECGLDCVSAGAVRRPSADANQQTGRQYLSGDQSAEQVSFSPSPWECVAATEHHGPYVVNAWGSTVCDLYAMSNPYSLSVRNGGGSVPITFDLQYADANARLIAAAPEMLEALKAALDQLESAYDSSHPIVCQVWSAIAKAEGRAR